MSSSYHETMKTSRCLPFRMGYLTKEMVAQAERELGETEEIRASALVELRKLVLADKKMVCWTDDEFLIQYLRARKFNVKKAFNLMHNSCQVKKSFPEIYDTCTKEIMRKAFDTRLMSLLPYRDKDGTVVLVLRVYKWDAAECPAAEVLMALTCLLWDCAADPATQVCGIRVLFDCQGSSLYTIQNWGPRYLYLLARALRNCLPIRFKSIHLCNESPFIHYAYSVMKYFLSDKLRKRVHFYSNQKELVSAFPEEILPVGYGGSCPDHDAYEWYRKEIENFYDKYLALLKLGYTK